MSKFISIPVSRPMIARAKAMCTGEIFNGHTQRKNGSGQFTGNLGELAFKKWMDFYYFENEWVAGEKRHHDFIVADRKIDVKAKERTVQPEEYHHCHVETRIKDADCDHYVMAGVRIPKGKEDPTSVHLLGWIPKKKFWSLPRDDDSKADTMPSHKILHKHLRPMDELRDVIETALYKKAFGET
jgi:hypothetical protein